MSPSPGPAKIDRCRICGNANLVSILDLGQQYLTGVFPRSPAQPLARGPLELVKCVTEKGSDVCGLVQLRHSCDPGELYGQNYGYRSGLNHSMVEHLRGKVAGLRQLVPLRDDDLVLDIGSNDGTTLSFYPAPSGPGKGGNLTLVGIDPTAGKFRQYYRPDIRVIADFFSAAAFAAAFPGRRARIVTSLAMFYDLDRPMAFMEQVRDVLADNGVWHFEQSYLPLMLGRHAYDTVCHEHLSYYALRQIKWMTDRVGLKIIELSQNDINGGSFAVTAAKTSAPYPEAASILGEMLDNETALGLDGLTPFQELERFVLSHRARLLGLLRQLRSQGKRVLGYGASTKGNVILQYCGLTTEDLPCIADLNPDKFGCVTPGTNIPIVSEAEAHKLKPDCFLVLPWHFRHGFLRREAAFLNSGGRMIFPLPELEFVPQ